MRRYNGFTAEERLKAFAWLKVEWAEGRRPRRPSACHACGQVDGILDYHSEDYSEPYGPHIGEHELCWRCHMMIHVRHHRPEAWDAYREKVRQGYRWPALYRRDFQRLMAWASTRPLSTAGTVVGVQRKLAVLDLINAGHYLRHARLR